MAGLLITMGTLGDRIGRRRLLMIGAVAFGAASLMAAYSTSAEMLIGARALLGIGGATLAPSTLALIRNMVGDDTQRRVAVGVWTIAFSAGFPLGMVIGGMLVEHFWWGSVFLINIPVMVLLLALAPILLPEFSNRGSGRFDLLSAAMSMAAILAVVWGLKNVAEYGWATAPLVVIVAGLLVGYSFIRRQRSAAEPLIDVWLFRRPAFSASIGTNILLVLASAGAGMLLVQHRQLVLGYSPFTGAEFGGAFGIAALGSIVTAVYQRELANSVPAELPTEMVEVASGSVGAASSIAEELPPELATALLRAAHEAFSQGIGVIAVVATCLLALAGLVATVVLHRVRLEADQGEEAMG